MARSAARLKMGYYPLPESEGAKLRELLSFTGPASVVDPCVGQGTALNLITQGADVRRHGVELDAERALVASAKGSRHPCLGARLLRERLHARQRWPSDAP
jgi:hypothetical protein